MDGTTSINPLLLVCKATHAWMLPFRYHSLLFTTSTQISSFLYTHDIPDDPIHLRFDLIRSIHVGPIAVPNTSPPSASTGDLQYGSSSWPITVLTRILWLAKGCTRLTVLNLDQNKWHVLEHALSPVLTDLALGPTHGPFIVRNLTRGQRMERFTSCLTYMRDEEVRDVVYTPTMRVVRRLVDAASMAPHWAVEQAACVDDAKAKGLRRMEIVLLGQSRDAQVAAEMMEEELKRRKDPRDGRVVVLRDGRDWMRILFEEFEEFRVAFVLTGGAGGLGLEASRALLEHGVEGLCIFDIQSRLSSSHDDLEKLKIDFPLVNIVEEEVDVRDEESVRNAVENAAKILGGVDVLLCFAGITRGGDAMRMEAETWKEVVDVNTTGSWLCAKAKQGRGGSIVFVASIAGHRALFPLNQAAYCVSKGGVLPLTKALAAEWAQYGIRVNSISPGYIDTPMTRPAAAQPGLKDAWLERNPMGRIGEANEITGPVILLCSKGGRYMTGTDIVVDGGKSLEPIGREVSNIWSRVP